MEGYEEGHASLGNLRYLTCTKVLDFWLYIQLYIKFLVSIYLVLSNKHTDMSNLCFGTSSTSVRHSCK